MARLIGVLDRIVSLKDGSLHGYKVNTRLLIGYEETPYKYVVDADLRKKMERRAVEYLCGVYRKERLFFSSPEDECGLDMMASLNPKAVVCVQSAVGLGGILKQWDQVKRRNLMVCLDDFFPIDHELREYLVRDYDYVFLREDLFFRLRDWDLDNFILEVKSTGSKVGLKRIETEDTLHHAIRHGVDLGHGFIFGAQEYLEIPW